MLTDDLFLARASCFPQASLVSSVGSLTCGRVKSDTVVGLWHQTHCRLPALAANSIGLSRTGFDFMMHSFLSIQSIGRPTNQFFPSVSLSVSLCVCEQMVLERLHPQFFTDFHEILYVAQKCGRFVAYRL